MNMTTEPHPLNCPKCGCQESRVIRSRRVSQGETPQPLPALVRTRKCEFCSRQFRTREQLEEISLSSSAWRVRIGSQQVAIEDVPQGEYAGRWTQHTATITVDEISYEIDTRNEMRDEDHPCRVIVTERGITVVSGITEPPPGA